MICSSIFAALSLLGTVGLQQGPNRAVQREAMKKLSFLVGEWSGSATVRRGPGEPLKITLSELIQYKLDGLVLVIEGKGVGADGKRVFEAFATVSYDDAAKTYRFRAFNDGRYLDVELKVQEKGFIWGYTSGELKVTNTMELSKLGEWIETTDSTYQTYPSVRSLEMKLTRNPGP